MQTRSRLSDMRSSGGKPYEWRHDFQDLGLVYQQRAQAAVRPHVRGPGAAVDWTPSGTNSRSCAHLRSTCAAPDEPPRSPRDPELDGAGWTVIAGADGHRADKGHVGGQARSVMHTAATVRRRGALLGSPGQDGGHEWRGLRDGWCGEPIAWARVGDPVTGREWTEHGWVTVTDRLSPAEAVRKYGPITELVVGFESVTYGETKFVARLRPASSV